MNKINISKCPSCGVVNMQEADENRINCVQCGANLSLVINNRSGLKKFLRVALVLVLLSSATFYYVSNKAEEVLQEMTEPLKTSVAPSVSINKSINAIPKLKSNTMTIGNEQFKQSQAKQDIDELRVLSSVSAKKQNKGQFWIVTIENQTTKTITRPRVMLKLLNKKNEKIESYTAWAKLETLPAGETTSILIDLPKVPEQEFHTEITAQSSQASLYDKAQQTLAIQDFDVSVLDEAQTQFQLKGTAYNPHNYQVDFVEIIAIAKDQQGQVVGYAKAYATTTNIKANQTSSFTLIANKYLVKTPYSWTLSALARAH